MRSDAVCEPYGGFQAGKGFGIVSRGDEGKHNRYTNMGEVGTCSEFTLKNLHLLRGSDTVMGEGVGLGLVRVFSMGHGV